MKIVKGKQARPQRVVIYGPESVGKSTLAAATPNPLFIDTEDGTSQLDVARVQATTFSDIEQAIKEIAKDSQGFKTIVLDTLDWAEKNMIEDILRKGKKDSIEDFGYGKGYVYVTEAVAKFLASLDTLIERGISVVLLAHSQVKKFDPPDAGQGYDRYELKMSKGCAPLVKEWADAILFVNFDTKVREPEQGKAKGVGGKERVIHTVRCAAWDAKNRHGLAEKLPMSYDSIASLFGSVAPAAPKEKALPWWQPVQDLVSEEIEDKVNAFLIARGKIAAGMTFREVSDESWQARMSQNPVKFIHAANTAEVAA
jgi:hypothetical protein